MREPRGAGRCVGRASPGGVTSGRWCLCGLARRVRPRPGVLAAGRSAGVRDAGNPGLPGSTESTARGIGRSSPARDSDSGQAARRILRTCAAARAVRASWRLPGTGRAPTRGVGGWPAGVRWLQVFGLHLDLEPARLEAFILVRTTVAGQRQSVPWSRAGRSDGRAPASGTTGLLTDDSWNTTRGCGPWRPASVPPGA